MAPKYGTEIVGVRRNGDVLVLCKAHTYGVVDNRACTHTNESADRCSASDIGIARTVGNVIIGAPDKSTGIGTDCCDWCSKIVTIRDGHGANSYQCTNIASCAGERAVLVNSDVLKKTTRGIDPAKQSRKITTRYMQIPDGHAVAVEATLECITLTADRFEAFDTLEVEHGIRLSNLKPGSLLLACVGSRSLSAVV